MCKAYAVCDRIVRLMPTFIYLYRFAEGRVSLGIFTFLRCVMFKKTDEELIKAFDNAKTRQDIADLLEIKEKSLRYFLFVIKPENMYSSFTIPKKRGGKRQIFAPSKKLRNLQRKLAYVLNLKYKPKICSYGFVKGKNILDNASQHTKKSEILNIDLKDFFTQFHFGRVVGMLTAKPYSLGREAAITIAQIACLNGILPQGAPTSPILTNMLCAPLDNHLMHYAKKHGLIYTRYADDITFSTFSHSISEKIVFKSLDKFIIHDPLKNILVKNSLVENEEKITLRTKNGRQEVTGLIVNKFPNVKREYIKNIQAILYNCSKNGTYQEALKYIDKGLCKNKNIIKIRNDSEKQTTIEEWFKSVIIGKIYFVRQIKGKESFTFFKLANLANTVFSEEIFDISYFDQMNAIIEKNVFVLQSRDELNQGSGFYVPEFGFFTSYHVTEDGDFYFILGKDKKYPISNDFNLKFSDKTIDYALYNIKPSDTTEVTIGKSSELKIGDTVVIAGFPDYLQGDTITKEECKITGITQLFGAPFYKVSGRVVHGASGGIVLNTNQQIVGIIKGGCSSDDTDNIAMKQGFVPIGLVLADVKIKTEKSYATTGTE